MTQRAHAHARISAISIVIALLIAGLPMFIPSAVTEDVPNEDIIVSTSGVPADLVDGTWDSDNHVGYFVSETEGGWRYDPNAATDEQWELIDPQPGLRSVTQTTSGDMVYAGGTDSPLAYMYSGDYEMGSTVQRDDADIGSPVLVAANVDHSQADVGFTTAQWEVPNGRQYVGQSFIPTVRAITHISLYLDAPYGLPNGDLTLTLYRGDPLSSLVSLDTATFRSADYSGPNTYDLVFNDPVPVDPFTTHFFEITATTTNDYRVWGSNSYAYNFGEAWHWFPGWGNTGLQFDLGFVIYGLHDLYGGTYLAKVTDTATGPGNEWMPWSTSNWTANITYQDEYIYESSGGLNVIIGDLRVTPVPKMIFYNYIDNQGFTDINSILSNSYFERCPIPETITLSFWGDEVGGPDRWNVSGSVSGLQTGAGTLDSYTDYTFSDGANFDRVTIHLEANTGDYLHGDEITFEVRQSNTDPWYPAYSIVNSGDTDLNSPYKDLIGAIVVNDGVGDPFDWDNETIESVYLDEDYSFSVSKNDIRVTDAVGMADRSPAIGERLNDVCFNPDDEEIFVVGDGFSAFSLDTNDTGGDDEVTSILDQSQEDSGTTLSGSPPDITSTTPWGQTFIPEGDTIMEIAVFLENDPSANITLYLYDDDNPMNGIPSAIASSTIPDTEYLNGWNSFNFPSPVSVTPGDMYLFTVTVDGGYITPKGSISNYANGDAFYFDGTWNGYNPADLAFRTYHDGMYMDQYNPLDFSEQEFWGSQFIAQGFYPTDSTLVEIDVYIEAIGPVVSDITMRVHRDTPTGNLEGQTTLGFSEFNNGWNTFSFNPLLSLSMGSNYDYVFVLETSAAYGSHYKVRADNTNLYSPAGASSDDLWVDDGGWSMWTNWDILFETYSGTVDDDQVQSDFTDVLDNSRPGEWVGQNFTPTADNICEVSVYLEWYNSGNVNLSIWTNYPGHAQFNYLGDFTQFISTTGWHTFTFGIPISVTPGNTYFIYLNTSGPGDFGVKGRWGTPPGPYGEGQAWNKTGTGPWWPQPSADMAFVTRYTNAIIDQYSQFPDSFPIYGGSNPMVGQYFTPLNNKVSSITVFIEAYRDIIGDIDLELYDSHGGTPLDKVTLFSGEIVNGWNRFEFDEAVDVSGIGTPFFQLSSNANYDDRYLVGAGYFGAGGPYAGGDAYMYTGGWVSQSNYDLYFIEMSEVEIVFELDQTQTETGAGNAKWYVDNTNTAGQYFTPNEDEIYKISMYLLAPANNPNYDLSLDLYEDADGIADTGLDTWLASTYLHYGDWNGEGWYDLTFTYPVSINPGTYHFFNLSSDVDWNFRYALQGSDANDYPDVGSWYGNPGWNDVGSSYDLAFKTYYYDGDWDNHRQILPDTDLHSICYDNSSSYVAVGHDNTDNWGAVFRYDILNSTWTNTSTAAAAGVNFTDISWHPTDNYAILCGAKSGNGVVFTLTGSPNWQLNQLQIGGSWTFPNELYALGWRTDGTQATIVGQNGGIVNYDDDGSSCDIVYNSSYEYTNPQVYIDWNGLCIRPPNSPEFSYPLGDGGFAEMSYSTQSQGPISAGVVAPVIENYDIIQSGGSKLKQKMDVGSLTTFYFDARNSGDTQDYWSNVTIDIHCWFDNGVVGIASQPPGSPDNSNRNSYFHLNYSGGSNFGGPMTGTWNLTFPDDSMSNLEVILEGWYETAAFVTDKYHHYLWVNVTLGPQVHNASGPITWVDPGDSTPDLGFANAHTWDVNATILDTQSGGNDSKYTEFGVYKFTSISNGGMPSGSFPPGGPPQMFSTPLTLSYASNCENVVNTSVTHLYKQGNPAIYIDASNMYVQNFNGFVYNASLPGWQSLSDIDGAGTWNNPTAFSGENVPLASWGIDPGPLEYMPSPEWGVYAFGPRSGDTLPNGTTVNSILEADHGLNFTKLDNATLVDSMIDNDQWDPDELAYLDFDADNMVSQGDVRITSYFGYDAGTTVQNGDPDLGFIVEPWDTANVTGGDGLWHPSTEGVYETMGIVTGTGYVDTGMVRVSENPMITTIWWWIQVPAGISEGRYTGTVTVTLEHK